MLKLKNKTPILWPPDVKNWLIWKDPDAGKDWRKAEQGMTENEIVGGHHQLDGYEFEQAPGVCDGQGSLACCNPWGHKQSDMTEQLNWTENLLLYLGLWIDLWSINDYITSRTGDMQKISSLSYAYLSNVHIFHFTISKKYIINNSINLIINLFWAAVKLTVTGTSSPSFFSWKLNFITDS